MWVCDAEVCSYAKKYNAFMQYYYDYTKDYEECTYETDIHNIMKEKHTGLSAFITIVENH